MKSNISKQSIFKSLFFFLIILIFAALNSCSSMDRKTVAPENRIPITPDMPQTGTWQSTYVVFDYEFVKENGAVGLIIDGRTKRRLDQIVIWALFLDKEGRLLERETVFNSGFRTKRTKARRIEGSIERTFEIPPDAKYMAFQSMKQPYRGRR